MYTHTFEIEVNGYTLEGDVSFSDTVEIKYDTPPELTLAQMERINLLFRSIQQLNCVCGPNVKKIEIIEK